MARKGLDSRLDRIMDALLPPGSMERREYHLAPAHRATLDNHRQTTAAIIDRLENSDPGAWYARYLDGDPAAQVPPMPEALRDALDLAEPPTIALDASEREAADAWQRFALGDNR